MKMGEYIQKRKSLFIITFILIIIVGVVSIYTFNKKGKESSNVQEQDLKVTYNITKDLLYPMDKETGKVNANTSTIVVKNNKSYDQKYKLVVKPESNSTLELTKIYIMINDNIYTVSELTNGILYKDTIKANEEKTISFKTWVGVDLINSSDDDKTVNLKYEIIKE